MRRQAFTDWKRYWIYRSNVRPGKWVWFSPEALADACYTDSHADAIKEVDSHMRKYPYLNGQR